MHLVFLPGLDELRLFDFSLGLADWVTSPSGEVLDGQIPEGGISLASINNVPIPGALWLLGSGLIGLLGLRRKLRS